MTQLVTINGETAVTTSLAIAEGTELDHASVIKLVRTYQADLEDFGRVGFEIRPFETAGGHQQREVAMLNEQQATLLLTYMRNSDIVRVFKKRLVKAFYEMAQQVRNPVAALSRMDILKMALDSEQRAIALEAKAVQQEAVIEAAKPKVAFVDQFVNKDGLYGLDNAARALSIPPRTFTRALYDQRYLFREGGVLVPYACWRDRSFFHVKVTVVDETARHQTFITPKGLAYFAQKFADLVRQPAFDLAS